MKIPGMTENAVVLCDECKKRIAVKGIHPGVREQGEYQIQYFVCPHCGRTYQIATTDQKQRDMIAERETEFERRHKAIQYKFRQKTINGHWDKAKALEKKINERAPALKEIGEGILHPGGGGQDGPADSESGATGV